MHGDPETVLAGRFFGCGVFLEVWDLRVEMVFPI